MFSLATDNATLFDAIGVCGFCLYVFNYSMLTLHKFTSHDARFFAINLCAASMVLIGLMANFNLAAALIQMFWVAISLTAILLRLRNRGGTTGKQIV